MENGSIISCFFFSYSVGERPLPSIQPSTHQKYKRRGNLDRRGGGLVLECQYILIPGVGINREEVVAEIRELFEELEVSKTVL